MAVTASMVKELRQRTGAGMLDCKKALEANDANIDKAIEFLREKGLSKAAKKAGRIAAEGLVKALVKENEAVILEINSETDFVAKTDVFVDYVNEVAEKVLASDAKNAEEFLASAWEDGKTANDVLTEKIAKIGENLSIRRFETINLDGKVAASYTHMGGKIGVVLIADGENNDANKEALKNVAMQIAAINPKYISKEEVDQNYIESERNILKQQALNEGKPEAVVEKMVEGRVKKLLKEICLLDQSYVKDGDFTVESYLKSVDENLKLVKFFRFETGEGIEKKEENFAEEVAKQMGQK